MTTTLRASTFAALALLLSLPGAAGAQDVHDRSPRVGANLALGLAGELDTYVNDTKGNADLNPSVGFDVRSEIPVLDFLVVGGLFQFMSYEPDARNAVREETFSFDAFVRARWAFEVVRSTLTLEPYVMFPLGLTLAALPDDDGSGDDIWPGFNTGILAGAQLIHRSGFGGYFELGWRHAEVYSRQQYPFVGAVDISLVANEMSINVGVLYVFGQS